jgi:hypothetical protein
VTSIPEQIEQHRNGMSPHELAELLGLSVWSVYRMIDQGMPAIRLLSGTIRLDPHTTAQWVREHTVTKLPRKHR